MFALWLEGLVRAHGWPPQGAEWERAFFGRDLGFVRSLKWLKEVVALAPEDLAPGSLEDAVGIVTANIRGEAADSLLPDPAPLVLVSTFDGYEVAHGRERLAAMLLAGSERGEVGFHPRKVEAWIGALRP